jgi:hypothetical protein
VNSVTVHARAADGDVAPLRTLAGPSTGLSLPVAVAVDTVRDELLVVSANAVQVFARTAAGDARPLRTLAGPATGLVAPTGMAVATSPPIVAAVLPSSRSVQVGTPATAFATVINAGPGPAADCGLAAITALPAGFFFQTTDPAGNTPTGTIDTAAAIPAGGQQSYVFGFTPSAPIAPTDAQLGFVCAGTNAAPVTPGLDTLLLVASDTPVPDIVALSATIGNTGIVGLSGPTGSGAFAVATTNVGVAGSITVRADTAGVALPAALFVCQTDPGSGSCLAAPAPSLTLVIPAGGTPTFGVFAVGTGAIPFDPALNRVFVRFTDGGVTRGATSVAIRTD